MFPHTITLFNVIKSNGKTTYQRTPIKDVFYYTSKIVSGEGKGEKRSSAYHVIFSHEALNKYLKEKEFKAIQGKENYFTLQVNDIIVLDEFDEINDLSDIQHSNAEYFLIKTISDNQYGEDILQNIEVTN